MKINASPADRIIRVFLGIALLVLGLVGAVSGALTVVFYVLGAILLLTGIVGFCPLYALFKFSTTKK